MKNPEKNNALIKRLIKNIRESLRESIQLGDDFNDSDVAETAWQDCTNEDTPAPEFVFELVLEQMEKMGLE